MIEATLLRPAPEDTALVAGANTNPLALASAIALTLRRTGYATVDAIGPIPISNAVRAATIARTFLREHGYDLTITPERFTTQNRNRPEEDIRIYRLIVRRVDG